MARLLALVLLLCVAWPTQARFVSADPVPPNANSGENFNRYAYANDTVTGLSPEAASQLMEIKPNPLFEKP